MRTHHLKLEAGYIITAHIIYTYSHGSTTFQKMHWNNNHQPQDTGYLWRGKKGRQ